MNTPKRPTKSTLDDLWHGRTGQERMEMYASPEFRRMLRDSSALHERLTESLTEEQKQLLNRLEDYTSEYDEIADAASFRYGFCLGARLMLEVLTMEQGGHEDAAVCGE